MSAFERAFNALREHVGDVAADELLTAVEHAHAHELAEKQRLRANTYAMLRSESMRHKAEGAREVADLIDPEVKSDA